MVRTSFALVLLTLTGCNKLIGGIFADTTSDLVLPKVMSLGDVDMGCAAGEALGGLIVSYGDASPKAARASVMTNMSAALCYDAPVWELDLAGARALKEGRVAEAKDLQARTARTHLLAAQRYLRAYEALEDTYGIPAPGEDCPKLKTVNDQLSYLFGLSGGIIAVLHDLQAQGEAGVPLSIPANVVRAADCLDDDTWWGAPRAMQASVWAIQPDAPGAEDAWQVFDESFAKGAAANVRLASAFWVQTAATVGKTDAVRAGIKAHANAVSASPADERWRMLDNYANRIITYESDRIWTAAVGYRTPFGALGTFPGAKAPEAAPGSDDLLDDLLGE